MLEDPVKDGLIMYSQPEGAATVSVAAEFCITTVNARRPIMVPLPGIDSESGTWSAWESITSPTGGSNNNITVIRKAIIRAGTCPCLSEVVEQTEGTFPTPSLFLAFNRLSTWEQKGLSELQKKLQHRQEMTLLLCIDANNNVDADCSHRPDFVRHPSSRIQAAHLHNAYALQAVDNTSAVTDVQR